MHLLILILALLSWTVQSVTYGEMRKCRDNCRPVYSECLQDLVCQRNLETLESCMKDAASTECKAMYEFEQYTRDQGSLKSGDELDEKYRNNFVQCYDTCKSDLFSDLAIEYADCLISCKGSLLSGTVLMLLLVLCLATF